MPKPLLPVFKHMPHLIPPLHELYRVSHTRLERQTCHFRKTKKKTHPIAFQVKQNILASLTLRMVSSVKAEDVVDMPIS